MKNVKGNKKSANNLPDTVAGKTGEEAIVIEFRKVYKELYNMCDDTEALTELKKELELDITGEDSVWEISKLTGNVVKAASNRLWAGKGDVTGSYNRTVLICSVACHHETSLNKSKKLGA